MTENYIKCKVDDGNVEFIILKQDVEFIILKQHDEKESHREFRIFVSELGENPMVFYASRKELEALQGSILSLFMGVDNEE